MAMKTFSRTSKSGLLRFLLSLSSLSTLNTHCSMLMLSFRFVDFGPAPIFIGIWEFATTQARRTVLQQAYAKFVQLYTADLTLPGPYLQARNTSNFNDRQISMSVGSPSTIMVADFPMRKLFV
jgi:hypothetical protein